MNKLYLLTFLCCLGNVNIQGEMTNRQMQRPDLRVSVCVWVTRHIVEPQTNGLIGKAHYPIACAGKSVLWL